MPFPDPIGEIAHMLTGEIGRVCCHKTGGYSREARCECRALALALIEEPEDRARLREYLADYEQLLPSNGDRRDP